MPGQWPYRIINMQTGQSKRLWLDFQASGQDVLLSQVRQWDNSNPSIVKVAPQGMIRDYADVTALQRGYTEVGVWVRGPDGQTILGDRVGICVCAPMYPGADLAVIRDVDIAEPLPGPQGPQGSPAPQGPQGPQYYYGNDQLGVPEA